MNNIHNTKFAGTFYPDNANNLLKMFRRFETQSVFSKYNNIKAIIVPHAGYIYSGFIAYNGFKVASTDRYNKIVTLSPSHYVPIDGVACNNFSKLSTPLGKIDTTNDYKALQKQKGYTLENSIFLNEHSFEILLPFIKHFYPNTPLTSLIAGNINNYQIYAKKINQLIEKSLLIVSSDLSHFHPYKIARQIDNTTIKKILNLKPIIKPEEACGANGINILITIALLNNWTPILIKYQNSGDTAGDKSSVVGYCSIIFVKSK